jgi:hypothetical protein
MKAFYIAVTLVLSVATLARADDPKEADIRQLIAFTGGANLGVQMAAGMSNAFFTAIKKANPQFPDRAAEVITAELTGFMREKMEGPDGLIAQIIPIYAQTYTQDEIRQLLAFYRTPLGIKMIQTAPQLAQESMKVGQAWGQAQLPQMQARIQAALVREGLVPAPAKQ